MKKQKGLKYINGFWCRKLRATDFIRVTDYHFSERYFEDNMVGKRVIRSASDKNGPLGYRPVWEGDWHRRDIIKALRRLYVDTASYIEVNNLGDTHQNESMRMAHDALQLYPEFF